MAVAHSSSGDPSSKHSANRLSSSAGDQFFVWREFLWGAIAGAFGEGMMHPVDTVKTRIQSQAILSGCQNQKSILQMVQTVWRADGLAGFYRGVAPGVTGSLATGATYFGVIESTKKWIEKSHPSLGGHWAHFLAGAIGDTLGSIVYVPCEVMKQRMQVQGTRKYWSSVVMKDGARANPGMHMYSYYSGMFQAGCSIWKEQGMKGLYAGYWSTLARDVPFAGLMVTFYEAFKSMTEYGMQRLLPNSDHSMNGTLEGLLLGGVAGGLSAYLTTPLDVVKTRLQVQGTTLRYSGWSDAVQKIWLTEGIKGMFRGGIPRIMWYVPASALTFMAVEFLREHFNENQYWSTLARDVPFAGLMVTFYEAFKSMTEYGMQRLLPNSDHSMNGTLEGLLLGGVAGGLSAYLTTPLDVVKTRLQVQGTTLRYSGWSDAVQKIWLTEGIKGMFRGGIPRIMWYVPASALTFMAVEFLREHFNENQYDEKLQGVSTLSIDKKGSQLHKAS